MGYSQARFRSSSILPISLGLLFVFDLLAERRREAMQRGFLEWVFCSEAGTALEERNVLRSWERVRRRALKLGVRPLRLHAARHTFATLALQPGKNVRWVADQLAHTDPALTLRVYAHMLPCSHDRARAVISERCTRVTGPGR